MFKYELEVENLLIDGHPHAEHFMSSEVAAKRYDELEKKYPDKTVRLFVITKNEIKGRKGKIQVPSKCPKGHFGVVYGTSVLVQGKNGLWNCRICGEQWKGE